MSEQDPSTHELAEHTERRLCECPDCKSPFVQPVYKPQKSKPSAQGDRWLMVLDCPECDYRETGTFPQDQYDQFTQDLAQGRASMEKWYNSIGSFNAGVEYEVRNAEIERFVTALAAEAILPEDF